jgi:hypothetical protein
MASRSWYTVRGWPVPVQLRSTSIGVPTSIVGPDCRQTSRGYGRSVDEAGQVTVGAIRSARQVWSACGRSSAKGSPRSEDRRSTWPRWGRTPPDDHGQQRLATLTRPRRSAAVSERSPRSSETRIVSRTEEVAGLRRRLMCNRLVATGTLDAALAAATRDLQGPPISLAEASRKLTPFGSGRPAWWG